MANAVWVELDNKPPKGADALAWRQEQCRLANNMLYRLTEGGERFQEFKWSTRHGCYILTNVGDGVYRELADNGEWFSLDYFGREPS